MSPIKDGLRDGPELKPIIIKNHYPVHNYTETHENDDHQTMVKIQLHGAKESVTIKAMIDSGATEDFIDREVCNKHGIKMSKAKKYQGNLPCGRKTTHYETCHPYDESTHGH